MPLRLEFRYRPALVRKMTMAAAEGAIVAGAITHIIYPLDNVLSGAWVGAAVAGGLTLLLDANSRRRARRGRAENEAAYQVALEETAARVQGKSRERPLAQTDGLR